VKNTNPDNNSGNSFPPEPSMVDGKSAWRRFLPVGVLVFGLVVILALMWRYDIRLDEKFWIRMADHHDIVEDWTRQNFLIAVLGFMVIYTLAVAFSVPGAVFLTLAGGVIFGWLGVLIVVISATLGALLVFLVARGAMADVFQRSGSSFLVKLQGGFDRSPFFWLLALRLMPVAPFWVVNIIPAMLGMRVVPYVLATLIGIIPGSLVFVYTGIGFSEVLADGVVPNLSVLSDNRIFGPILALSLLAVIPALIRSLRPAKEPGKELAKEPAKEKENT